MKKNLIYTIVIFTIMLNSCSSNSYSAFVGHWEKVDGDYYFNGKLESIDITKNGKDIFVKVNCRCDAKGEKLAIKEEGKLKIPILMSGDNYLILSENGKQLKFLGDTFEKRSEYGDDNGRSQNINRKNSSLSRKELKEKQRLDSIRTADSIAFTNAGIDLPWK